LKTRCVTVKKVRIILRISALIIFVPRLPRIIPQQN
jgi:hypothetical protein